ncbi:EF-P lysine aminoacylase GenX [Candidatus Uhrbacteria bacterium]|nr:EF-P lysine aminoacylase GenX [Candidatus Uhrbacteria bacterium]
MDRFEEIKQNALTRSTLVGAMEIRRLIREWFLREGFVEVETPVLVRAPGQEPYLNPLETVVRDERGTEVAAYLITSPEYALKKLLVAGFPKIFELARCFRNGEPRGRLHNPEFTMLEWYRAGTDYRGIMEDCERLVYFIAQQLPITNYQLPVTFFAPPWERLSVRDAFNTYADTDLEAVASDDEFFKIFLSKVEPHLGRSQPTILYDYPASMAALARIKRDDPRYAERFEVYINGIELANAFSELGDADEQRERFLSEQETRRGAGRPIHPIDEEFLAALKAGLPECGGIALGVDRLAMVLLDAKSIREVVFFPYS